MAAVLVISPLAVSETQLLSSLRLPPWELNAPEQLPELVPPAKMVSYTFTLPVTINGGQSTSAFSADIWGVVLKNTFGFVDIDFNTPTQHFTFQNSQYTGSFDFNVASLEFGLIGKGSDTVNWYGYVTNAVETPISASAPEPGALALLGLALAGTGIFGSRKRLSAAR